MPNALDCAIATYNATAQSIEGKPRTHDLDNIPAHIWIALEQIDALTMDANHKPKLEHVSLETVEIMARLFGPFSAGGRALTELHARQSRGENVAIFTTGKSYIVGTIQDTIHCA